jgi:deoxyribodipyrimidine photo-lyase
MADINMQKQTVNICWLRRDLRLHDHHALDEALQAGRPVLLLFIFDRNILSQLSERRDKRVAFIHQTLFQLNRQLLQHHSSLYCVHDTPFQAFQQLLEKFEVKEVFVNHDYEPYAIARDGQIRDFLKEKEVGFHTFKDQVIFEKSEIMKPDGSQYTVFTPYSRVWKSHFFRIGDPYYPSEEKLSGLYQTTPFPIPALESMGFGEATLQLLPHQLSEDLLRSYNHTRNIPGVSGTSQVSTYLRFGVVSIRELVRLANQHSETWLNELIWREFFMMILFQFPRVVDQSFKPQYDRIPRRNNEEEFDRWCRGETGYPIVDAGMRQLNQTGWMHNRVRLIVASFLVKHLLIDWRWGEAYFAEKLLDYELASNNGNWQWAAGSGCDAAPYFRIFNPWIQAKKFDPKEEYVKRWVDEYPHKYVPPMVDHEFARKRALETYKRALSI